jgi:hypothetical protein
MSSQLLRMLMDKNGISNKEGQEKARMELAGAITRVVVNEALAEAKQRAKARDEAIGAKEPK